MCAIKLHLTSSIISQSLEKVSVMRMLSSRANEGVLLKGAVDEALRVAEHILIYLESAIKA